MDSRTRLDHALFQLTPTRTRCELVIFTGGGGNEKLASGILAPFLNHLESAKDQISKGGYSITLRPSSSDSSHWFTKSTLQRFVRFVNQPEVLERFVTLEKEIVQIENSIQSNELTNGNGVVQSEAADENLNMATPVSKPKGESNGTADAAPEESSKVRLQRVLETRRAVLCKEQAMAYARALVAGFEPDYLGELVAFADAFGASRLREACLNFVELCKQKNEDRRWMDELAAMQACPQPVMPYLENSGIILAGEDVDPTHGMVVNIKLNGGLETSVSDSTTSHGSLDTNQENGITTQTPSVDGKAQVAGSWAGQFPPYIHSFQGQPMFHPYQPYMFPGMQVPPGGPFYPPNMKWPLPATDDSDHGRSRRGSKKKQHSEEDSESSYDSEVSEGETGAKKASARKSRKKKPSASRKVVIRNINYISSKRGEDSGSGSEDDDDDEEGSSDVDRDSIKQRIEEAVGSLERHRNPSSRRHRKHKTPNGGAAGEEEKEAKADGGDDISGGAGEKRSGSNWDAFQNLLLRDEEEEQPCGGAQDYFSTEGTPQPVAIAKKQSISSDDFVVVGRDSGAEGGVRAEYFEPGAASVVIKKQHCPDEEFMFPQGGGGGGSAARAFGLDESSKMVKKCPKDGEWFVGDQQGPAADPSRGGDPSMIFDGAYLSKRDVPAVDDSFMVQDRFVADQPDLFLSIAPEIVEASRYEYENDGAPLESSQDKNEDSYGGHEPDDLFMVLDRDSGLEEQAMASWTPEMDYNNTVSLAEKKPVETETTKPVEAKSKSTGKSNGVAGRATKPDLASRAKRPGLTTRTTGPKSKLALEEENRRKLEEQRLERQRRIAERSAGRAAAAAARRLSAENRTSSLSKIEKSQPTAAKPILRSSTIERLSAARNPTPKAPSPAALPSSLQKKQPAKASGVAAGTKKLSPNKPKSTENETENKKAAKVATSSEETTKNLNPVIVAEQIRASPTEVDRVSDEVKEVREEENVALSPMILAEEPNKKVETVASPITSPNPELEPGPEPEPKPLTPAKEDSIIAVEEYVAEIEDVPEMETSTPPAELANSESPHSRKTWNSEEQSSPKASKGFRKLLLFGRKTKASAVA